MQVGVSTNLQPFWFSTDQMCSSPSVSRCSTEASLCNEKLVFVSADSASKPSQSEQSFFKNLLTSTRAVTKGMSINNLDVLLKKYKDNKK